MTTPTPAQTVDDIRATADDVAASNNPTLAIGAEDESWIVSHETVAMETPVFRAIAAEFHRMRERIAALEAERDALRLKETGLKIAITQRDAYLARAETAEADLAEARKVLEPFANAHRTAEKYSIIASAHTSYFRAARAFLAKEK